MPGCTIPIGQSAATNFAAQDPGRKVDKPTLYHSHPQDAISTKIPCVTECRTAMVHHGYSWFLMVTSKLSVVTTADND